MEMSAIFFFLVKSQNKNFTPAELKPWVIKNTNLIWWVTPDQLVSSLRTIVQKVHLSFYS